MKLDELLAVGNGIQITWQGRTYPSMLLDYDDRFMYASVIGESGKWMHLAPGTEVTVSFGVQDKGYFRFKTNVEAEVSIPAPALKMPYPENMNRVQQRRFFRLAVQLPVSYRIITDLTSHQSLITYPGHTVDLSAGGLQLVSLDAVQVGDVLEVDLLLGERGPLSLNATVRRVVKQFDGRFQVAVEYAELQPKQEDMIIRWLFQEQARRRRLGLR